MRTAIEALTTAGLLMEGIYVPKALVAEARFWPLLRPLW